MKATKLPSGNYRAIAYLGTDADGKRLQKSFTAPDAKHAIALAAAFEDKHRIASNKGTFDAAMQKFLRAKEPFLSPSTFANYNSCCRVLRASYPVFCAKHILFITADDLRALIADMQTQHPPRHRLNKQPRAMSAKTIKNYIGFISAVFRNEQIAMPAIELPRRDVPDIYVPTDAEVKTLIDCVRGTDMYVPVLLAAFGPLRRGEICALEYPRDFNGNVIHIREALALDADRNLRRKSPKTPSSDRRLEMPPAVIEAITAQGYVTDLTPNIITARFEHILKNAGLPHFRFHDLRHYCVSTLHAQGVPDAYIMQRGGWSTDNVLKSVYRHTLADQERLYADKALKHFGNFFD